MHRISTPDADSRFDQLLGTLPLQYSVSAALQALTRGRKAPLALNLARMVLVLLRSSLRRSGSILIVFEVTTLAMEEILSLTRNFINNPA
jgi:hypothetical protein